MKIVSVVGVRPNIIKFVAWSRAISRFKKEYSIEHVIVHSGQHYDDAMFHNLWRSFDLPDIDYRLNIGSGSHAWQVGMMMIELEKVLVLENPDWVIAIDDVNTALATGITAKKLNFKLAHIEAGLRSYDKSMPEEHNRILVDHLSDLLFAPDQQSHDRLIDEGIDRKNVKLTGNFMADTLLQSIPQASQYHMDEIVAKYAMTAIDSKLTNYALFTLHRPSNIQEEKTLKNIITFLTHGWKGRTDFVIWPIHPGVLVKLKASGLFEELSKASKHILLLHPVDYVEMLQLTRHAKFVLTDSGGLQEETSILGIPCITMRENTERPITLLENGGTNVLAGNDTNKIDQLCREAMNWVGTKNNIPYWEGNAAERGLFEIINYF